MGHVPGGDSGRMKRPDVAHPAADRPPTQTRAALTRVGFFPLHLCCEQAVNKLCPTGPRRFAPDPGGLREGDADGSWEARPLSPTYLLWRRWRLPQNSGESTVPYFLFVCIYFFLGGGHYSKYAVNNLANFTLLINYLFL